ncbi:tape measure protein [Acinetobacter sp. ANC 4945]|uniref:tape measure protein n=1 Tax=Acinetobacter amyesii TaxID=2942470 RepID=UPI000993B96F|nr:tape measure protein [Acinetobacter amyesii]MCL6248048.1 tape measure protein [Acinetobacter amyesii]
MSGKNLTFKLILDGDSKGLVSAAKQSEDVTKRLFDSIKSESEKIKQASEAASGQVGNIIPKGTTELADKLTQSLTAATGIIQDAGDNAKSTAGNFTDFGNKAEKALGQLKSDLTEAKRNLEAFSKTNASPADIEVAQRQVDQLEKEVQQADQAFNDFHAEVGRANNNLKETDNAAQTAQKGIAGLKTGYTALVGAMAALGIGLGIKELAEVADSYTNLSARINIATSESGNFTQAMAGVHQVALMTNTSLDATAGLFTKVNDVGKQMGMTQQQTLDLTKTINMAIQTGGGSAASADAAITQLTQALQSGVLRGDEFNSIMEQAPGISKALAQSLGVTTSELRKMAENGELTAEKVINGLHKQSAAIEADYAKFPTTIGNALQRISTQWQILIGTMDQANGASATVAQWLVTLADNMGIVEILLNDVGSGFVWIGDQLSFIDVSIFESLKSALSSAYDAIKEVVVVTADLSKTITEILSTSLTNVLSVLSSFTGEATAAGEQVSFLERILQGLSITFGFIADGVTAIKIGVNLLAGAFFDLASAANSVLSAVTWGDVSKQFASNADLMKSKAKEYYAEADKDAVAFESKGLQRLEEAAQTQEEKNAQTLLEAKSLVDQLLLEGQRELDGKKVNEQEKLDAVQAYAEAAIAANNGAMDGVMQADLMTKGYIVTLDEAGKVAIQTWDANATGAEKAALSADKARKAAATLKLDLYELKNGVTEAFNSNAKVLNDFANNVEALGLKGEAAGEAVYQAWLKWLETAQSQNEVDLAISKLQEFGKTGQMSAKQVELGMLAVRQVVSQLPADLDPVEQAFERLGIKTKEQLKLAAQSALADFNTIQSSGEATAESLRQAYERTMQAAAASGDQAVIAATQAKAASLGLEVQIDSSGKASVKSYGELEESIHRVRRASSSAEDGFRNLGQTGREEADSVRSAWEEAVSAASSGMHGTRKGTKGKMAKNAEDIEAELKAMGYSDAAAKQHAKDIYEGTKGVNGYKSSGFGFFGGLSNVEQVNRELERMQQYAPNNVSTKASSLGASSKSISYELKLGNETVKLAGSPESQSSLEAMLKQLGTLSKST